MSYSSHNGRKPFEKASKMAHINTINDLEIKKLIEERCSLPKAVIDIDFSEVEAEVLEQRNSEIELIVAVDGGYTNVSISKEYPSASINYFQIGVLLFELKDLENMSKSQFIDPKDMAKLKNLTRLNFILPSNLVLIEEERSLGDSIRLLIYELFMKNQGLDESLNETLKWFIFQEYIINYYSENMSDIDEYFHDDKINGEDYANIKNSKERVWILSNCPCCGMKNIKLLRSKLSINYIFKCPKCSGNIYLTDVFRLYESLDEEKGATEIPGYVTTLVEQFMIIYLIKMLYKVSREKLKKFLFIKDGPLSFNGPTANMHKPMRKLMKFLHKNINLIGLEKSGAFVEHANMIAKNLEYNSIFNLDTLYIRKNIKPGNINVPYAHTTYYSNKFIYKNKIGDIYVATLPSIKAKIEPKFSNYDDFINIYNILPIIEKLRCDMYESSIVPIALVNRLVSISNCPSANILEKFSKKSFKD